MKFKLYLCSFLICFLGVAPVLFASEESAVDQPMVCVSFTRQQVLDVLKEVQDVKTVEQAMDFLKECQLIKLQEKDLKNINKKGDAKLDQFFVAKLKYILSGSFDLLKRLKSTLGKSMLALFLMILIRSFLLRL